MGPKDTSMTRYSPERKKAVIAKMAHPHSIPIQRLARDEGIPEATLYVWRQQARAKGILMPDSDDSPAGWSALDKFNAVLETAALSQSELAEYCRKKGLYPEQIARWKDACQNACDWQQASAQEIAKQRKDDRQRIHDLEKELHRKEKALAEAAALLVLRKKLAAILGEEEA
jgi:transposase-like protein